MKLEQVQLPVTNQLYVDYVTNNETIAPFFEYENNQEAFELRANYLQSKMYDTNQLANIIALYMEPYGISEQVHENIEKLRNGALAVVGGQQAGILTGPLYSVHKAITVLLVAKKQEQLLQKDVVPVFWIAGEDHDIEEINHTYTVVDRKLKKRAYSVRTAKKTIASKTEYDQTIMVKTIRQIFADFGETNFTAQLLAQVEEQVMRYTTYTELFTALMNDLFKQYGLLMIDAAFEPFRKFESSFFLQLIQNHAQIARVVVDQENKLHAAGYAKPITAVETNANVFYVKDGERHLLQFDGTNFKNEAANIFFTLEELTFIAQNHPEQLSNNVVTRPLMQEMTIPVLTFVGGPGELAYWATLKPAFEQLNLQMPIFTPRIHVTIVSRKTQSLMAQFNISPEDVIRGKMKEDLQAFIASVQDEEANELIAQMEQSLLAQYDVLQAHVSKLNIQLDRIMEKNKAYHVEQLNYLRSKITAEVTAKHDVKINQYTTIQNELAPENNLQERLYNPYMFINEYGPTFIDDILRTNIDVTTKHQTIYL